MVKTATTNADARESTPGLFFCKKELGAITGKMGTFIFITGTIDEIMGTINLIMGTNNENRMLNG